jgi:hypothetical protein
MIEMLFLSCVLLQQDPVPAGSGFEIAAANYAKVAEGTGASVASLDGRVTTVRERVESLGAKLAEVDAELTAVDRLEIENLVTLRERFVGADLEARVAETERTFRRRRELLLENKRLLQQDRTDAAESLRRLQMELDLAQASAARKSSPAGIPIDAATRTDERIRSYCRRKAAELGTPTLQPVPAAWLRATVGTH